MSLRHAILGLLTIRPMSGYDLKRAFDTSVRHFWTADQAAIYRTLAELETAGWVVHERIPQTARPDRKEFAVTPDGQAEFTRWLATTTPSAPRREPLLVKLFFAEQLDPAVLHRLLQAELAPLDEELGALWSYVAALEQRAQALPVSDRAFLLGPLITLSNGLQLGLAYRAWLTDLAAALASDTLTADTLLASVRAMLPSTPTASSPPPSSA